MKIILLSDDRIRLHGDPGALSIEAESTDRAYTPFHMVASGLATCVFSVLDSWAEQSEVTTDDLVIEVGWEFADGPRRIGRYTLALDWPSLPQGRRAAAERAAQLCPIHATLEHPPEIGIEMTATPAR